MTYERDKLIEHIEEELKKEYKTDIEFDVTIIFSGPPDFESIGIRSNTDVQVLAAYLLSAGQRLRDMLEENKN